MGAERVTPPNASSYAAFRGGGSTAPQGRWASTNRVMTAKVSVWSVSLKTS
jgi:hypothetical protein